MLIKILKSSEDKNATMSKNHKAHKVDESSEGDHPSKYEQTHKLTLIYSDIPKKVIIENSENCRNKV